MAKQTAAPSIADFTHVGLTDVDARSAVEGMKSGKFVSFQDACITTARQSPVAYVLAGPGTSHDGRRKVISESKLHERSARLRTVSESTSGSAADPAMTVRFHSHSAFGRPIAEVEDAAGRPLRGTGRSPLIEEVRAADDRRKRLSE